ncbi:MAG: phosphoribosylglycinamide formyltransferase [Chitinophagaceae bacterium]
MKKIALFASGSGSNVGKILEYFKNNPFIQVKLVLTNNPKAGVLNLCQAEGVASLVLDKEKFFHSGFYPQLLRSEGIDLIVLAGFLWKVPSNLLKAFPSRIINLHPALLPKYGGKGMFGHHVHEAVLQAKEKESGITIHYVNENYDEGQIILQRSCPVDPDDSPEKLAQKVQQLEHKWLSRIIEQLLMDPDGIPSK